jgi:hypothetical protein
MARMSWMLLGMLALPGVGCQSLSSFQFSSLWEERPTLAKPDQVAAFWMGGVDVKPNPVNGTPVPGFGGKILFLRTKPGDTVAVDGTITFQLFEDKQSQGQQPAPLEQWVIQPEHLPLLLNKDMSGWGYNVWLPWSSYAPTIQSVRMIVMYQDKSGTVLYGEPMTIPIQDSKSKAPVRPAQLEIRQNSFQVGNRLQ